MSNKQNTSRVKREMLNGDDEGALEIGGQKQTQSNLRNEQKALHRKILSL